MEVVGGTYSIINHYFSSPLNVAASIRRCVAILVNYNTFQPEHVYDIFVKIRQRMVTLDSEQNEAAIQHEEYRYLERLSKDASTYHNLLEQYTAKLHHVLEMSDIEMQTLTQFANARDSEQGWELEWQNQVRILLDLNSKYLTSTFREGKLCYPKLFPYDPQQVDKGESRMDILLSKLETFM